MTESVILPTLAVLGVATSVGLVAAGLQCQAAAACLETGDCKSSGFCSYENTVSLMTDAIYADYSTNMSRFEELTRGVCAPGERLHVNLLTNAEECIPWRAWPNALNHEIQGSGTSHHELMCGSWIEAGPTFPTSVFYWSFFDGAKEDAVIRHSEATSFSSARLASTDLGKLYAACQHTVLGGTGAIRESAVQAYSFLESQLGNASTRAGVLYNAGVLAGHHCDGPAQSGVTLRGSAFAASISRGSAFAPHALGDALLSVDAPASLQTTAESANELVNAHAGTAAYASFADLERFFEGASRRLDHASVVLQHEDTPQLNGLLWLVDEGKFTEAQAFLKGVAAFCAFSIHTGMTLDGAGGYEDARKQVHRLRSKRPRAAAMGRLRRRDDDVMELEAGNKTLSEATTTTFSSLHLNRPSVLKPRLRLDSQPLGNPTSDCVAFSEWLFPDRLDNQYFDAIVTPTLYARLETMIEQLRTSVAHVVVNDPQISSTLVNPATVATEVQQTRVRVAGAPRGTWGGIVRGYVDAGLSSRDGPMVGALKQARALHLDRMDMLFDLPSACSGPPLYAALHQNAYIYPGGRCTHLLLGILRKPFADERYDDVSLATRAVYIVAHELAHNTLVTEWKPQMNSLLHRYASTLHSEAIADVVAAVAIIHSGLALAHQVCEHISQLWCARTPMGYTTSSSASHPGPNERGDWLCLTLQDLGYAI